MGVPKFDKVTTAPPMAKPVIPTTALGKPPASAKPVVSHKAKTFSIVAGSDAREGEKILLYAKTGTGKTSLSIMVPDAVYIDLDGRGRRLVNPLTNTTVNKIPDISGFQDLRDALHQTNLFSEGQTVVIDTYTKLEAIMEPYIFDNYTQGGKKVTAMRGYGWDGPAHILDCHRLLLSDLDGLVRRRVNVLLVCQQGQATVANAEGVDYLEDGPRLSHNKQYSSRMEVCEWCDHVLRIGYQNFAVSRDTEKAKVGKVDSGDNTRVIFTNGASHFIAKSGLLDGKRLPAVVSFASPSDDSLWAMMFRGAIPEVA